MKDLEIAVQNHDYGFIAGRLGFQDRRELFIALGQWLVANPDTPADTLSDMLRAFINSKFST